MATATETDKKIVLRFNEGSYTFGNISLLSTEQQMYDLAQALNQFQSESPKSICKVVTLDIM